MHQHWEDQGRGRGFVKRAYNQNPKRGRFDVMMSDVGNENWQDSTYHRVVHNVSEDAAFEAMARMERRLPRMMYSGGVVGRKKF